MKIKALKYRYLIQQYKNNIFNYSLYLLKNRMDAEDAAQETMIRIWKNMDSFKMKSAKQYIMKTTHNLCIDYLRKRKRGVQKEFSFDEEFAENFYEDANYRNVEEVVHQKIMSDKIKEAINILPDNLKSVFVLYEIEGMKYKEISEILDLPMSSIKINLYRARKTLRGKLSNYQPEDAI